MRIIIQFLESLGAYAVPLVFILLEVVAALILLNGFMRLQHKKRAQEGALRNERLYYQSISEGKKEVQMLLRRLDLCPLYVTGNFEELLHVSWDAVQIDINLLMKLLGRKDAREFWDIYRSWDGAEVLQREFQLKDREQWIRMEISHCKDGDNDFWVFYDVTDEKQNYERLEAKLEEARNASQYKTTFLSKMSHEIRTPMNGIIGMLALAHTQMDDKLQLQTYLEKAENLSQYLLSLINDILDMSRIEAGKVELEQKEFSVYMLAEKMRNLFQKNVEAKGIQFQVEVQDFDAPYLIGDELRISQILVNFLSNAVKFTEEGEIRMTFRQMVRDADYVNVMMRVHDTGIGMEPDFIYHIFRPFEQENVGITKKYGGSGLGMAITDQLVRLMGGEIVVESMPQVGSDFTVFLNLKISDQAGEQPVTEIVPVEEDSEEEFSFQDLRILMAEDNEINAEIAVNILEMYGAIVEVARDGKQAVEQFAMHDTGYYDFILMDIQMPVMNGYQATEAIRSMKRSDAVSIPIFALSADAFVEDKRHAAEMGMNGHFSKPINFEEMRNAIGRFLKEGKS